MPKVVGIDLGTSNCRIAVMDGGRVRALSTGEGYYSIPSHITLTSRGEILIGRSALPYAITNNCVCFQSIRRLLGARYDEPNISEISQSLIYEIVRHESGHAWVKFKETKVPPQQLLALLFMRLKQAAQCELGEKVEEIVLTVPAHFNYVQQQAARDAASIAGLKTLRVLSSSTAAALAYGLGKKKESKRIVVYDLGGGTFNISIIEICDGIFEVKSISGDTFLGGQDFDTRLADYLANEFKRVSGIDLRHDKLAMQRLKDAAERAKIELSCRQQTEINLPFIITDQSGPKELVTKLTRAKFDGLVDDLIQKTFGACEVALRDASLQAREIDEVVLVGGMTRMPRVVQAVRNFFEKEPHKGVNPDEVVVAGAAIQAAVLEGNVRDILLLDVVPLSLGIDLQLGPVSGRWALGPERTVYTRLIDRNTTIPTTKRQVFSTADNNQNAMTIRVFQGERDTPAGNKLLGKVDLEAIPSASLGVPIEVTLAIPAPGIVYISSLNTATNKAYETRLALGALSEEDIFRMAREVDSWTATKTYV